MTSNYPRIVVWCALAIALWLNYQAWVHDYGSILSAPPALGSGAPGTPGAATPGLGFSVPRPASGSAASTGAQASPSAAPATQVPPGTDLGAAAGATIHVRTDVLEVAISATGGTLVRADLLKYPLVKGKPAPVELENDASPETLYLLQSGLTGPDDAARPTHHASFTTPQTDYTLANGEDELRVPLTWTDGHGVTVTKTYIFRRGKYQIDLQQSVANHSDSPWPAAPYAQILRYERPVHSSMFTYSPDRYAFRGPALYDGTKYRTLKITSAEDQHLSLDVIGGWMAAPQHDFVSAVIPPAGAPYRYTLNVQGNEFELATAGPMQTVPPGATASFDFRLFVGPMLQAALAATAPKFDLVANYGHLTILAKPLFWLLERVHGLLHNWGVAIIIVTFLLKLLFYPLSEASGRSMAKMKALAPRIKSIQETYKDDREKAGRAMMELYKREKINPVAGCLPIVIQIPVFLAFYWVLLGSVEMRQAPFFGWITDLSSRDPWFVLPGIMAAAMFVQYKLNPAPPDPMQAKIMMVVPFAMSVMFAFFPAGLVLYWVTNTVLSIAQQWNINRRIEAAAQKKRA
ncbi:MAG TPA: membrane protein insertase YidC [Steroidobacteraceae bacterium]|nr:membrane protein insertase YidC [Steroidobacteraceae bacterium]